MSANQWSQRPLRRQLTKTSMSPMNKDAFKAPATLESDEELAAAELESKEVIPSDMSFGMVTQVGYRHRENEDFGVAIEDLFTDRSCPKLDPAKYGGPACKKVSIFSVFDGHGGGTASKWANEKLHQYFAEDLWTSNIPANIPKALRRSFDHCEQEYCAWAIKKRETAGTCATMVVVRGDEVYCGNAGDSKAMIFEFDEFADIKAKNTKRVDLNPRHGADLQTERKRILQAGGSIDDGAIYGILFPSRGFGDLDIKSQKEGVVVCTPEGAGIVDGSLMPQECYRLNPQRTSYLVVASDGLWDFMTDDKCIEFVINGAKSGKSEKEIAQVLLEKARNGPIYEEQSDDDITIIVVKLSIKA